MMLDDIFNPGSCPYSAPGLQRLRRCISLLAELDRLLPEVTLATPERTALGGGLAAGDPVMVLLLASSLDGHEALFAGYPAADPADLRDRQQQAFLALVLRDWLEALSRRAADHHLLIQGDVFADVLDLLRLVRLETCRPAAPAPARARARVVAPVDLLLEMLAARRQAVRRRNAEEEEI
jgi:hypothetical protein